MNDNAINRAIAHTHFMIVAVIVLCLALITVLYLTLSSGVHLGKLKLGRLYAEKLYLKWDDALQVEIGTIALAPSDAPQEPTDLLSLQQRVSAALQHLDDRWIGSLRIDRIRLGNDLNASLFFDPRRRSNLHVASRAQGHISITLLPVHNADAYKLELYGDSSTFGGTFRFEGVLQPKLSELYLGGSIDVAEDIHLRLGVHATRDAVTLNTFSTEPFASVAPIVKPLHLSDKVEPWIVARAQGGPVMLDTLQTTLPFAAPAKAFDNLFGQLTFHNARYRFANDPGAFEPALAEEVTVLFEQKVLKILPHNATFYGEPGGDTHLAIDFSGKEPLLKLSILTSARFTPPLQRLTASYGVDLPFTQTRGLTDTNLSLTVNLAHTQTTAKGSFKTAKSRIDLSGLSIDVSRGAVDLKDSDVTLRSVEASLFDGNVTGSVTGAFNPTKHRGTIRFNLGNVRYPVGSAPITLSPVSVPLHFEYRLDRGGDTIRFDASQWHYMEHNLTCDAFTAPFDLKKARLNVPKTVLALDQTARATVEGEITLAHPAASLLLDLTSLHAGTFATGQAHTLFNIRADENLSVVSNATTHWSMDKTPLSVSPFTVSKHNGIFRLSPAVVSIEHQLTGSVEGVFEPATMATELNVTNFRLEDEGLGRLFQNMDRFSVYIVPIDDEYDIVIPSINMVYSTLGRGWRLHFFSLDALTKHSPLLRDYNLTESTISVWSENGNYPVAFNGIVDYPYALTAVNGTPVNTYRFQGSIEQNGTLECSINDRIKVHSGDTIRIRTNGVDFSQPELTRFYRDHHFDADSNASESNTSVSIDANDTAILFPGKRQAKADRITIDYSPNRILGQLYKGGGGAKLDVKGETFYLFGYRLDDDFMNHFFNLSKVKGGTLDFYMIGEKDDFKGLAKINDTTVYDYVLFNNLFAFINTVPALVTFSLPSYETKGIKVQSAYTELAYHKGVLTASNIKIDSKELDFAGQGTIDYNKDRIKMQLTVKTRAAENIRKIPLVGYILVGDDKSVLTTLNINGPLNDPKVENTIAKDIIVSPFNILKRTLDFPLHYLKKLDSGADDDADKGKEPQEVTSGVPPVN
ncbi:AsmA-like C-terminal domain-containing protein [Sulfurimonas sp. HSL1-6]|uniref:YhdP family protein n=1 Tax=Thiomicrolovo immobilis TaxID=3131935 RepID=UPI0031F81229